MKSDQPSFFIIELLLPKLYDSNLVLRNAREELINQFMNLIEERGKGLV